MSGIPADCISTAELCGMVRANKALLKAAIARFEEARQSDAKVLREWAESDSRDDGGTTVVGDQAIHELERMAIARLVLMALHDGRIELNYLDERTGERLRFDSGNFPDNTTGLRDLAAGGPPMFGPHEYRNVLPFLTREKALAWLKHEFESLANAPLPSGFVTIQAIENRLTRYLTKKGKTAEGVVMPYTDKFGNWINSQNEQSGRMMALARNLIWNALSEGRLACEYWRMDIGFRLEISGADWSKTGEAHGRGLLGLRLPPDISNLLAAGVDLQSNAALFGNLIFDKQKVDEFLDLMAPHPAAGEVGGFRNQAQLAAEKSARGFFQSLGPYDPKSEYRTKPQAIAAARKTFPHLSEKAAERAWQNGAHESRKRSGAKRKLTREN